MLCCIRSSNAAQYKPGEGRTPKRDGATGAAAAAACHHPPPPVHPQYKEEVRDANENPGSFRSTPPTAF